MEHRFTSAERFARGCRWIGLGAVVVILTGFTPVANDLAQILRPPTIIRPGDAIVVLGSAPNPDGTLNASSLVRFVEGTALYRQNFAPIIVYSGLPDEVETRSRLAQVFGVPAAAIIEESRSLTTSDEAHLIAERLHPRSVRRILLVTNSQHLSRAGRLFERAGFEVVPVSADELSIESRKPQDRLALLRVVVEEIAARLYYRASGRL